MEIKSNLGDFTYDNKDVVRIFNPKQRDLYLMNGIMPKDIYKSEILLDFEGYKFSCPVGYDYYLKKLYGNYTLTQ